jgi:hypothetical protein
MLRGRLPKPRWLDNLAACRRILFEFPGGTHARAVLRCHDCSDGSLTVAPAPAQDKTKFPDWSGQWSRVPDGGVPRYDPSKPIRRQEALLKPEYQARHEASMRDQDAGGFGLDTNYACFPSTMPRTMSGISRMEFLFAPNVTHILFEHMTFAPRRIYTDGRDWPKDHEPTFLGYWVDNTCTEANPYVTLEGQTYFLSAEGKLMPLRKDQPPPDLKYFNQAKK